MNLDPALSLDSVVTAIPEQTSVELAEEVVVLDFRNGEYFGLNPVAAAVWSLIQEPRSLEEVRSALLDRFTGVSEEQCTEELMRLMGELLELGLIRVERPTEG